MLLQTRDVVAVNRSDKHSLRNNNAAAIGLLAAALIPSFILAISLGFNSPGNHDWIAIIKAIPFFYWWTVLLTFPITIPAYLLARRYNLIRWWSAVITGTALGFAVFLLVHAHADSLWNDLQHDVLSLLEFDLMGGLSGLVFWFVWKRLR